MTRRRIALTGAIAVAVSLAGCVLPPRSGPAGVTPLPDLPAVAVYRFVDDRGQDERLTGRSVFHGRSSPWPYDPAPRLIRAREPVATTVSRAVAAGLRARGFAVVDRTDAPFAGGEAAGGARHVVSGRVLQYWAEHHVWVSGPAAAFTHRAECTLVIETYPAAGAHRRWEKRYSRAGGTVGEALARAVRAAVLDRELVGELGGRPD